MATDHLDGFDHYGSSAAGVAAMLEGAYAEVDDIVPSTARPRTGTHSMRATSAIGIPSCFLRRAYKAEGTVKFLGWALVIDQLPNDPGEDNQIGMEFRTNANARIMSVTISTTGQVEIRNSALTLLASSAAGVIIADDFQHLEAMCFVNGAASAGEVRVNGVVAVSVSGVNFGSTPIAQYAVGKFSVGVAGVLEMVIDDLRAGDDEDGVNDDFIGDKRILTLFPDADGAENDWAPDTGTDRYARVDEAAPDDDTSYIQSEGQGDLQQLTFPALPDAVTAIAGVMLVSRAKKTDAGVALFSQNMIVDGERQVGEEVALATAYAYHHQVFDLNPDGFIPWTPSTVDALTAELEHIGGS